MKKTISVLTTILLVILTITSASALDYGCDVDTVGEGVYLEELNTGIVLYEKNADEIVYPASTTKIMTYIIVSDNVADFDGTMIEITEDALATLDPESSVMGLKDHIGESFSVRDLLYGLMLPSGNDAALVLSTYVGDGDIDAFVEMMNDKADEIGCVNTHFVNPHGLFDPNHYSTPRDMSKITKYALDDTKVKDFAEITNTKRYTPKGFSDPIVTTNYLIDREGHHGDYYYPAAEGIKTGFTDEAGRCLVSTAAQDDYRYLCIDFGAAYSYEEDVNYAMLDSIALYNWAFENVAYQVVYPTTSVVANIAVGNTEDNTTLDLVPREDIKALLPIGYKPELLTVQTDLPESVDAPINQGSEIDGSVKVFYDGEEIAQAKVCASASIDGATKSEKLAKDEKNNLIKLILIIVFVVAALIIIIIVILVVRKARRKKREVQRHRRRYY